MSKKIAYTKQGYTVSLGYLFAVDNGVYGFNYFGDENVIDPFDGSTWTWEGTNKTQDEIIGVFQEENQLTSTFSLNDCKLLDGSFFWDSTNGVLYVHWINSIGDWSLQRSDALKSNIIAGYASGYSKINKNILNNIYYKPIITGVSGLARNVDPTKFGLIAYNQSTLTLSDEINNFYLQQAQATVGEPFIIYYVDENATELTNDDKIFTGVLNGYAHDRSSITYQLTESRFFQNKSVCPNTLLSSDFPNAGELEGSQIPVAWGDIRRGKMLLTNEAGLSTGSAGSAVFLVADPSFTSVRAITKVYDKDDIEITIDAVDLNACTVRVTKPAGISVSDLKAWKWEGQGYDISGTYNNGLDILKSAFLYINRLPYIDSLFNITQWDNATLYNTETVGISIMSDKGLIEALAEPITTSLQGILLVQGDGRITFINRDPNASVSAVIEQKKQLEEPKITMDPTTVVSELVVNYSPDFTKNEYLPFTYSVNRGDVVKNYKIDRRDPLSPVQTILTNTTDCENLAIEIMETSKQPERRIETRNTFVSTLTPFNIIAVDTGLFNNKNLEYGEILSIDPDPINNTETIKIRVLPDYTP